MAVLYILGLSNIPMMVYLLINQRIIKINMYYYY